VQAYSHENAWRDQEREIAKKRQVQSSMKHVMMKHSGIVSGIVAFGLLVLAMLALEVDFSFLNVVGEQKRAYVLLGTGLVCLFGSGVGTFVARSKAQGTVLSLVLVLGIIALAVGLYFLTVLGYHERAYTPLGIGTVCLFGGTVGAIVARLKAHPAAFIMLMVPGLVALGVSAYFLTTSGYHERAYIGLAMGTMCLLGGIVGTIVARSKA
jgi:hypothetical protein